MIVNFLNNGGVQKCTREEIVRVLEESMNVLRQPTEVEVNVAFVSAEEIKVVNAKERKKDVPTDVLSFPAFDLKVDEIIDLSNDKYKWNINPENEHFCLGDILLCKEVAKKQAEELGHTLKAELVRLVVHSVLHLVGYDHIEDADYEIMHAKELEILKKCGYDSLD
mgnify:CR=1 FL=1